VGDEPWTPDRLGLKDAMRAFERNILEETLREWCIEDPLANRLASRLQGAYVVDVEPVENVVDSRIEVVVAKKITIGCGSGCETARDRDTETAEITDHFAERGVLATNDFDVIHAKLIELDDVLIQCLLP